MMQNTAAAAADDDDDDDEVDEVGEVVSLEL